jgi:hypothetical protein
VRVRKNARLFDRSNLYQREIERLHTKYLLTGKLYEARQDGVPFSTLSMNARKLARIISRSVAREEYQFEPGTVRSIRSQGKLREVFSYRLTDLIVHRAITTVIEDAVSPLLSSRLYSYRKGWSWLAAASDFAAYIRKHVKSHPDTRNRGLYVVRRDVASYTDTIPVGKKSRIWEMIRQILESQAGGSITPYEWSLIEGVVRPAVCAANGAPYCLFRGLPTGQPIAPVLYNLYLNELDHELDGIAGAFYGRYSDDIVFAHFDLDVVEHAARRMEEIVAGLGLELNPAKRKNLYLTAAGRPPSDWIDGKGTSSVPLVGTHVSAHGTVALNRQKMRALLREVNRRAIRTAKASQQKEPAHMGPIVCSAVNRALEPQDNSGRERSATLVRRVVTDRSQLKQLDYWIARIVVGAVTGEPNVRAFRKVSYREIRQKWGLKSVLHARNDWKSDA